MTEQNRWQGRVTVTRFYYTDSTRMGHADVRLDEWLTVHAWVRPGRTGEILVGTSLAVTLHDDALRVAVREAVLRAWRESVTSIDVLLGG